MPCFSIHLCWPLSWRPTGWRSSNLQPPSQTMMQTDALPDAVEGMTRWRIEDCNLRPVHLRLPLPPGSPRGRNLRDPILVHPDPVRLRRISSSFASASGCRTRRGRRSFLGRVSRQWLRSSRPKVLVGLWSKPLVTSFLVLLLRSVFVSSLLFFLHSQSSRKMLGSFCFLWFKLTKLPTFIWINSTLLMLITVCFAEIIWVVLFIDRVPYFHY